MRFFFALATKAIIPEGPLIQLAPKSQLKLTCLLEENYQTRKVPSFVFWYKDGAVINWTGRAELRVISNFIDGHHFYNRSSNVHSSNSQLNTNQDSSLNLNSQSLSSHSFASSSSANHQSSPYLATNHNNNNYKYSSSSNYDHHHNNMELKSPTDFHLPYISHLNNEDDENTLDELFERDDQARSKEIIVSILTIDGVRPSDSGEYGCKPSYAEFANCTVQVLKDGK